MIQPDASVSREEMAAVSGIPLMLEAVLDSRSIPCRDVLNFGEGSVVRMSRPAGSSIRLLVGGVFLARAEIVIQDGKKAVRITSFHPDAALVSKFPGSNRDWKR